MSRTLRWLPPHEANLPTIFNEYLDSVRSLPVGSERLYWNRDVLRQKDIEIEKINQFRDRIFEASWTLIDRFAASGPTDAKSID
jgi:hypothetical protein